MDGQASTSSQPAPVAAMESGDSLPPSSRTAARKQSATDTQQTGFISILSSKIDELEKSIGTGNAAEREAAKLRKKELRSVIKTVADLPLAEKVTFLQNKYTVMAGDMLKQEKQLLDTQAQLEAVTRERDKVQVELRKSNQVLDKMQELCRQLQKENKEVFEDTKRAREEDAAARAAIHTKFQAAVSDVTAKLEAQASERAAQMAENDNLRAKLGEVLQQFETFNQLVHKKDLEVQLANAKLEQQVAYGDALVKKNEILSQANEQLSATHQTIMEQLESLVEAKKTNAVLAKTNQELRAQLDSSHAKYNEFAKTLEKSTKMFANLKRDLDSSIQERGQLRLELASMKRHADTSTAMVTSLAADKEALSRQVQRMNSLAAAVEGVDAEGVAKLKAQNEALQRLCRTLQQQVKSMKTGAGADHIEAEALQAHDSGSPAAQVLVEPGTPDQAAQDSGTAAASKAEGTEQSPS